LNGKKNFKLFGQHALKRRAISNCPYRDKSQCLVAKHSGILAEKREKLAFATTAKFLRFPNEKPEKPIFLKKRF